MFGCRLWSVLSPLDTLSLSAPVRQRTGAPCAPFYLRSGPAEGESLEPGQLATGSSTVPSGRLSFGDENSVMTADTAAGKPFTDTDLLASPMALCGDKGAVGTLVLCGCVLGALARAVRWESWGWAGGGR